MTSKKYKNRHCEQDGIKFPSIGERDCYLLLKLKEKAGEIHSIKTQVKIMLTCGITLRVDFSYMVGSTSQVVYAEYKGFETKEWKLKKKLWKGFGPGLLKVYQGYGIRIHCVEDIVPDSKIC